MESQQFLSLKIRKLTNIRKITNYGEGVEMPQRTLIISKNPKNFIKEGAICKKKILPFFTNPESIN